MTYGLLFHPFRDKSGREVGSIFVFDELASQPWKSSKIWGTNLLASATLSLIGTFVSVPLMRRKFQPERLLQKALELGESTTVEFKEGLRWDHWQERQQTQEINDPKKRPLDMKNIAEGIAVKNIAAFLNNREGGTLFIGIADDKRIVGLERDYQTFVKPGQDRGGRDKDRDRFQLHLRAILTNRIGREVSQSTMR